MREKNKTEGLTLHFGNAEKNCRPYPLRVPGEWAAVLYLGYSIIFSALKQLLFRKNML